MWAPRISVIIPYYNGESFIAETLDSLFADQYPDLEVIVVSDGSPQESLVPLEPYKDRITLLAKENGGQASARNLGISRATGEIIALIDQDDLWPTGRTMLMLPHLAQCDYVRGNTDQFIMDDGKRIIVKQGFQEALIGSALYRKAVFEKTGLFDETLREGEDFDWNIRLRESGCTEVRIPETVFLYRRHEANQSLNKDFIKNGQLLSLKRKLERMRNKQTQP
jgi:glycosyltransferase involved in cell wall biosynthesis